MIGVLVAILVGWFLLVAILGDFCVWLSCVIGLLVASCVFDTLVAILGGCLFGGCLAWLIFWWLSWVIGYWLAWVIGLTVVFLVGWLVSY